MSIPEYSSKNRPTLLVIAGSGRSGTSVMAGLLERLGGAIPKPEVPANHSNPKGFAEPQWVVDFHNSLLASVSAEAEDPRPDAITLTHSASQRAWSQNTLKEWLKQVSPKEGRLVVKDPRIAWFLPLYRQTCTDLGWGLHAITMLRHPAEAMNSRAISYGSGVGVTSRLAAWINMMLQTEASSRSMSRAFVRHESLLQDWEQTVANLGHDLELDLLDTTAERVASANQLIDPKLVRATVDWSSVQVPSALRIFAEETYTALTSTPVDTVALDAIRKEYNVFYRECEDVVRYSLTRAREPEARRLTRLMRARVQRLARSRLLR